MYQYNFFDLPSQVHIFYIIIIFFVGDEVLNLFPGLFFRTNSKGLRNASLYHWVFVHAVPAPLNTPSILSFTNYLDLHLFQEQFWSFSYLFALASSLLLGIF